MAQRTCIQCGTKIEDGGRFCPECGRVVPDIPMTMEQTVDQTSSQTVSSDSSISENKGKKIAAVSIVVSVLLSIIIILAGTMASAIFIIRKGLNQDSVESAVKEVDFTKLKVSDLSGATKKKEELPTVIYNSISPQFRAKMGDEKKAVRAIEKVLKEDFVQDFVAEKAADYMSDILTGSGEGKIEVKEVMKLLRSNQKELAVLTEEKYQLTDEDLKLVENYLKENEVLDSFDLAEVRRKNKSAFSTIQNLCSYTLFAVLLGVSVILIIVMFVVNRNFRMSMVYTGASLLLIGILDCVIGTMTRKAAVAMNDIAALGEEAYVTLLAPARTCSFILGGCMILAGVLAVVLPLVLRKRQETV